MTSEKSTSRQRGSASAVPFWRDVKHLSTLAQLVAVVASIGFVGFLVYTAVNGMAARGIPFTFGFLSAEAGFTISEGSLLTIEDGRLTLREFRPTDAYLSAFVAGLLNTLKVAAIGILLATVLGLAIGVARLSSNGLLRTLTFSYVEAVRNTPLLVQMFFWYFAVFLSLPAAREAAAWYGGLIVTNQGTFVPWPVLSEPAGPFVTALVVALLLGTVAYFVGRKKDRGVALGLGTLVITAIIGLSISGLPFTLSVPELGRFRITGGASLSPEFVALLLSLVIYTGAFIAEVVRGAVLSIPGGQLEASRSLGLTQGQTMRLVILPQAVRVMIPPIGNLYLSLMKNTSLAVAIGYPDLFNVYKTVGNQSGRSLEGVLIVMVVYLVLSLLISGAINAYNQRVLSTWGR